MPSFIGLSAAEVLARVTTLASTAAGSTLVVRVGAEAHGVRNVGVDLPRTKTKHEGALLRLRVREALERAGVVMAENALAPKVFGAVLGQVQVTASTHSPFVGDFARLNPGLPSRGGR